MTLAAGMLAGMESESTCSSATLTGAPPATERPSPTPVTPLLLLLMLRHLCVSTTSPLTLAINIIQLCSISWPVCVTSSAAGNSEETLCLRFTLWLIQPSSLLPPLHHKPFKSKNEILNCYCQRFRLWRCAPETGLHCFVPPWHRTFCRLQCICRNHPFALSLKSLQLCQSVPLAKAKRNSTNHARAWNNGNHDGCAAAAARVTHQIGRCSVPMTSPPPPPHLSHQRPLKPARSTVCGSAGQLWHALL